MAGPYMPASDVDFHEWANKFSAYAVAHAEALGLTAADITALTDSHTTWNTDYSANMAARTAAKQAVVTKDNSRAVAQEVIRALVPRIQVCPTTTDADREGLGITIRKQASSSDAPVDPSGDKPMALIDITSRLTHVLKIKNLTSAGVKSGKPSNVVGCEVWRKLGEAPVGPGEMELVGIATRTQYVVDYLDGDGGKQAYYALRWINGRGEKGSWSETESATVAA